MILTRTHPQRLALVAVLGCGLAIASGCLGEAGLPPDAAPVVEPESARARQALAERETMLRERQQQEARARQKRSFRPIEE